MITVSIAINGVVVHARSARNLGVEDDKGRHTYQSDDGGVIHHKREDGAIALARKLLARIKEV